MHHILEAGVGHGVATPPQALHIERQKLHTRHVLDGGRVIQTEAAHVARRSHRVLGEHHHGFPTHERLAGSLHRGSRIRNIEVDSLHLRKQEPHVPLLERPARNHEAHRARACHLDHRPVDIRDVVTDQEHRTFPRDVLHAGHEEPVMHGEHRAQKLAQKRLRQGPERPDRPHKAYDTEDEEQVYLCEPDIAEGDNRENVEHDNAEVLHHIGQREHMASRTRFRVVEHGRKHREREDTAAEPEKREGDRVVGARDERNEENEHGGTGSPHRDKAHLDKVLGHAHREPETRDKADSRTEDGIGRESILVKQGAGTELVLDDEHHEEDDDPEHRLSDERLAERPVLPGLRHLATSVLGRPVILPGELQILVVSTDGREPEGKNKREKLEPAKRIEHGQCQVSAHGKSERHAREEHRAERHYHERPASVREEAHTQKFLQVAVLRRTLEGLQHKEQPHAGKHHDEVPEIGTRTEQANHRERKKRRPHKHAFLRVLVRSKARRRQKQHAGQQEQQVEHIELPRTRRREAHAVENQFSIGNNRRRDGHLSKSQAKKRKTAFHLFHFNFPFKINPAGHKPRNLQI